MKLKKEKHAGVGQLVVRKAEHLVPVRVSGFKNLSVDQIVWMKLPAPAFLFWFDVMDPHTAGAKIKNDEFYRKKP